MIGGDNPSASTVDEFDFIGQLMKPLARGAPEALGLLDDAAVIPSRPGFDLVVTKDAIVEGVHFLPSDPLDLVARKLLRVNLSDLAAKAAAPYAWFLAVSWPARCGWPERQAFAEGLRRDQDAFGLTLLGGDTTSTPGPLTASATLLGWVPAGQALLRSWARAGASWSRMSRARANCRRARPTPTRSAGCARPAHREPPLSRPRSAAARPLAQARPTRPFTSRAAPQSCLSPFRTCRSQEEFRSLPARQDCRTGCPSVH